MTDHKRSKMQDNARALEAEGKESRLSAADKQPGWKRQGWGRGWDLDLICVTAAMGLSI